MDDNRLFWLVTASSREHQAISQGLSSQRHNRLPAGQPQTFHFSGFSLLLVYTGMGPEATTGRLLQLLDCTPCAGLISIGYCGALQQGLHTGDVILYSECGPLERNYAVRIWFRPSLVLLSVLDSCLRAKDLKPRIRRAVSSPSLVAGTVEKKRLGERTGAGVVDMESSTVFQLAHRWGVPRAAIRVVLDEMAQPLDGIQAFLDPKGQFTSDTIRKLLLHAPGLAMRLKDLDRKAARTLTAVAAALPPKLLEAQTGSLIAASAEGTGTKQPKTDQVPAQLARWMDSRV
jgi:nucleoside phosphorylase